MQTLLRCDRRFDRLTAAGVEFEEVRYLVLGLGGGWNAEAGGSGGFVAYIGLGCNELEQIERDIFRATRCGGGFHEVVPLVSLSLMLMGGVPGRKS